MKRAVFLDVDDTLILTTFLEDGTRKRVLNELLINRLKEKGTLNLYLFTNMNLTDLKEPQENRITRAQLVKELEKRGFKVCGVITPADPGYGKKPGKAYKDLYMKAYKETKSIQDQTKRQNALRPFDESFNHAAGLIQVDEQYRNERAAGQKQTMLRYFLQQKPKDLEHILYFDDDESCLKACQEVAQEQAIRLTTCRVDPSRVLAQDTDVRQQALTHYAEEISYDEQIDKFLIVEEPTSRKKQKGAGFFSSSAAASSSAPAASSSQSSSPS